MRRGGAVRWCGWAVPALLAGCGGPPAHAPATASASAAVATAQGFRVAGSRRATIGALPAAVAAFDSTTPAGFRVDPFRAYPVGGGIVGTVALGDVNGDRRLDAVVTTELADYPGPETVHVFLQNANGTLAAPRSIPYSDLASWAGVTNADLDRDGVSEIIVGHAFGYDAGITVLRWQGGTFATREFLGTIDAIDVVAADLDGDGYQDIFAQSWADGAEIYYGDGSGGVSRITKIASAAFGYNSLSTGDFTGDGLIDVAVTNGQGYPKVWIFPAKKVTTPLVYDVSAQLRYPPGGLSISDLDTDGDLDMVLATSGMEGYIPYGIQLYERGAGNSLAPGALLKTGREDPEAIAVGDLDGNGLPDIVTMHASWNEMGYFLQQPGGFDPEMEMTTTSTPWFNSHYRNDALALGDLDGNGCSDIAIADAATESLVVFYVRNCRKLYAVLPKEPGPKPR
jgi:hypothetical protein